MHNSLAIARRILSQFMHDKRTLALLFVAPIIVLWLLSVLLGADSYVPRIATVDLPNKVQVALEAQEARITDADANTAEDLLRANDVDALLRLKDDNTLEIWAEGSDSTKTAAVASVVAQALSDMQKTASEDMKADLTEAKDELESTLEEQNETMIENLTASIPEPMRDQFAAQLQDTLTQSRTEEPAVDLDSLSPDWDTYLPVQNVETTYLHGNENWKMFDFYGPLFIGIFVFVFVFLTSGMSLVNERSAGTMTRFLATPVKPVEVLGGYTTGFGLLALAQSTIVLFVALTFIGFPNEGSLGLVVAIVVSMALASVTLGLLVSGLASSAFQVIQLMLLFVTPQILLSGLFDLSNAPTWLQALGQCFPITYGADALRAVMLRGADFTDIAFDFALLWGFIIVFFVLAAFGFRKKRARG